MDRKVKKRVKRERSHHLLELALQRQEYQETSRNDEIFEPNFRRPSNGRAYGINPQILQKSDSGRTNKKKKVGYTDAISCTPPLPRTVSQVLGRESYGLDQAVSPSPQLSAQHIMEVYEFHQDTEPSPQPIEQQLITLCGVEQRADPNMQPLTDQVISIYDSNQQSCSILQSSNQQFIDNFSDQADYSILQTTDKQVIGVYGLDQAVTAPQPSHQLVIRDKTSEQVAYPTLPVIDGQIIGVCESSQVTCPLPQPADEQVAGAYDLNQAVELTPQPSQQKVVRDKTSDLEAYPTLPVIDQQIIGVCESSQVTCPIPQPADQHVVGAYDLNQVVELTTQPSHQQVDGDYCLNQSNRPLIPTENTDKQTIEVYNFNDHKIVSLTYGPTEPTQPSHIEKNYSEYDDIFTGNELSCNDDNCLFCQSNKKVKDSNLTTLIKDNQKPNASKSNICEATIHAETDKLNPNSGDKILTDSNTVPIRTEESNTTVSTETVKRKRIRNKKERLTYDKENHKILPPCSDKCRKNCKSKITAEERQEIWDNFWSLLEQRRRDFITRNVVVGKVGCRTTKKSTRSATLGYYLKNNQVCKTFFLHTIGYQHDRVVRTTLHANHSAGMRVSKYVPSSEVCAAPLTRGKHRPAHAFDERYKTLLQTYIEKYQPVPSHYNLKHAPNRRYLPVGCNFSKIYKDFLQYQIDNGLKKCSWAYFHQVIKEMNISTAHPSQDKCKACVDHDIKHEKEEHLCSSCDCAMCKTYPQHIKNKTLSRKHMKDDQLLAEASNNKIALFTFDMQKVILMPKLSTKDYFFLSKLVLFNETFAIPGDNKGSYCMVWHEGESGRKAYNIASALVLFLKTFGRDFEQVILYSDNCNSQNKNKILYSALLRYINNTNVTLKSIKIEYLEVGHTYMSADSVHSSIATKIDKSGNLYDKEDFLNAMRQSRRNIHVEYFTHEKVYEFQNEMKVKFPINYNVSNLKIIQLRRGHTTLFAKNAYEQEDFVELNVFNSKICKIVKENIKNNFRNNTFNDIKIQDKPRGISEQKRAHLQQMLNSMPNNRREFFENLEISDVPDLCVNIDSDL